MGKVKETGRRWKTSALQKLGVSNLHHHHENENENSVDAAFEKEYERYKRTCSCLHRMQTATEEHINAIRMMQESTLKLVEEMAELQHGTKAENAMDELATSMEQIHQIQLEATTTLCKEQVQLATKLLLWQEKEVERKMKDRKKLLVKLDSNLKKYEHANKVLDQHCQHTTPPPSSSPSNANISKRQSRFVPMLQITGKKKSDVELANNAMERKAKLDATQETMAESTSWLLSQFNEMEEKRIGCTIMDGPFAALVASHLHTIKASTEAFERASEQFQGSSVFTDALSDLDKLQETKQHEKKQGMEHDTPQGFGEDVEISEAAPSIVCDCIDLIMDDGLHVEGLFRVPGNSDNVEAIQQEYKNTGKLEMNENRSVHDICTVLKGWFRESPTPVFPECKYDDLMGIIREDAMFENEKTIGRVIELVTSLPKNNREVIYRLCRFLNTVTEYEDENRMNARNLATCFAPSLIRAPSSIPPARVVVEIQLSISIIEILILHALRLEESEDSTNFDDSCECGEMATVAITA